MTTEQALSLLDQATQPGARMFRSSYVQVEQAIRTLADALSIPTDGEEGKEESLIEGEE